MITFTLVFTTELDENYTYTGLEAEDVRDMIAAWMDETVQSISIERE